MTHSAPRPTAVSRLSFHLESPAVAATGLQEWSSSRQVLAGHSPYRAAPVRDYAPHILPPTAQRRCSASTRLAVQAAQDALAGGTCPADTMTAVFASSVGDPEITDQLCRALAFPEPMVSPTRFHNSVHNVPAGYWSIATGSLQPTTSLAAYDGTFAAGLLAAAVRSRTEGRPVMLVAYDQPYPEPLSRCRVLAAAFSTAMILTPEQTSGSLLRCRLTLAGREVQFTTMETPALEELRNGCPAARALPLLARLAAPAESWIALEYLSDTALVLECRPC